MDVAVEAPLPPAPESAPVINPNLNRFLGIIKNRLQSIIQKNQSSGHQAGQQELPEQQKKTTDTALSLKGLLDGQPEAISSLTTSLSPTEPQPQSATAEPTNSLASQPTTSTAETPAEPAAEPIAETLPPTPVTYTDVQIDYQKNVIVCKDASGKQVQFSLSVIAADMARTLGLPDHQIALIEQHLSHQPADLARTLGLPDHQIALIEQHLSHQPADLAEIASSFGFLTADEISLLLGIPQDEQAKTALLNDNNTPDWQKALIKKIEQLPEIPKAGDIISLFTAADLPTNQPFNQTLNKLKSYADQLPEERKSAFNQLLSSVEAIGADQTVAQAITSHYQKLEAGEDIDFQETQTLISSLFSAEKFGNQIGEQRRQQIIDRAVKIGKTGGIIAGLLAVLLIWQGAKQSRGSQQ